jgi:hypothetical protein
MKAGENERWQPQLLAATIRPLTDHVLFREETGNSLHPWLNLCFSGLENGLHEKKRRFRETVQVQQISLG